jgi:transcription elongation factor Elf1
MNFRLQKLNTTYTSYFCSAVRVLQPFKHTNKAGSLKHNRTRVLLHCGVCQMEEKEKIIVSNY